MDTKIIFFLNSDLHIHIINGHLQDYPDNIKDSIIIVNNKKYTSDLYNSKNKYVIISFCENKEFIKKTIEDNNLIHYYTQDITEYFYNENNILFNPNYIFDNIGIIINYYFYDLLMYENETRIKIYDHYINHNSIAIEFKHNNRTFGNLLFIIHKINNTVNSNPYNTIRMYNFDNESNIRTSYYNIKNLIENIHNKCIEPTMVTYESNILCSDSTLEDEIINKSRIFNKLNNINTEIYYDRFKKTLKQTIIGNHNKVIELWEKIKKDERHNIIHFNIIENYKVIYEKIHTEDVIFVYKYVEDYINQNIIIKRKRQISKGGQSKIYIAYDENTNNNVILKEFEIKRQNGLLREYNILKSFPNKPNIVKPPSILNERTLIFENPYPVDYRHFIDGLIFTKKYFPIDYILYVIKTLISIGAHLKKYNIYHFDYKTENVCFSNDLNGEPILIDFGNAAYTDELDKIKNPRGTLHYMAPELLNGTCVNNEKSDIWSLGIFLLEILINDLPWDNITKLDKTKLYKILLKTDLYQIFYSLRSIDECDIIKELFSFMLNINKDERYGFEQLDSYLQDKNITNTFKNYENLVYIIEQIKKKIDIRFSINSL